MNFLVLLQHDAIHSAVLS